MFCLAFSDICSSACFISSNVMTEYCFFWKSIEVMVRLSMSIMLACVALWCTILLPLKATVASIGSRAVFENTPATFMTPASAPPVILLVS